MDNTPKVKIIKTCFLDELVKGFLNKIRSFLTKGNTTFFHNFIIFQEISYFSYLLFLLRSCFSWFLCLFSSTLRTLNTQKPSNFNKILNHIWSDLIHQFNFLSNKNPLITFSNRLRVKLEISIGILLIS